MEIITSWVITRTATLIIYPAQIGLNMQRFLARVVGVRMFERSASFAKVQGVKTNLRAGSSVQRDVGHQWCHLEHFGTGRRIELLENREISDRQIKTSKVIK